MINLFILNENITNGYIAEVLNLMFLLIIICSIFVIISKNPIVSVLFLIGLFSLVAFYLILLGMNFIGLSYLIVYIGAVSILFLFILMLINVRISEIQTNTNNSIPIAIIITILFSLASFRILPYDISFFKNNNILNNMLYIDWKNEVSSIDIYNNSSFLVTSKMWDGNLVEFNHITSIGNIMYTNYNIWLIITSFILLLAMVGAIIITIKQKND
jgi:NADH-ubiquinone oxidoreductase chain 6